MTCCPETLEREMERVEASIQGGSEVSIQPRGVMQAVKAVCALLGSVETLDITTALDSFNRVSAQLSQTPQVVCVNIDDLLSRNTGAGDGTCGGQYTGWQ
ncbi:Phosphatidylinositol 4-phosphate 3-kinase C2 domain-containing subunit alpha [Homalodisca vitripennis]|nr:Phosphatidylinositol 4-phosphate 3-kinase C2 domain-containing subunit alpha [Homalodisca vitripennis]